MYGDHFLGELIDWRGKASAGRRWLQAAVGWLFTTDNVGGHHTALLEQARQQHASRPVGVVRVAGQMFNQKAVFENSPTHQHTRTDARWYERPIRVHDQWKGELRHQHTQVTGMTCEPVQPGVAGASVATFRLYSHRA